MDPTSPKNLDSELESFRQQWLTDLQSRTDHDDTAHLPPPQPSAAPSSPKLARKKHHPTTTSTTHAPSTHTLPRRPLPEQDDDEGYDYIPARSYDDAPESSGRMLVDAVNASQASDNADVKRDGVRGRELVSALDHYEEAMEKEAQGQMGDSLTLYRRAYRMDTKVDRRYREKHFPASTSSHPQPQPQSSSQPSSTAPPPPPPPQPSDRPLLPIADLIASFAPLTIEPAPAPIENTPPPPCPLSTLPEELLVHILRDVAIDDVGDFARLGLVCRRLAYLVATEERIWKRVATGDEVGFGAMWYHWQRGIRWDHIPAEDIEEEEEEDLPEGTLDQNGDPAQPRTLIISASEVLRRRQRQAAAITLSLAPSPYPTFRTMLRSRPRVRFNGCYISTVNYIRTGQASTNQTTWGGSPILIVTYYRYLRFFRDGTAISLLTTSEPGDVVHHVTKELLDLHRDRENSHLPSAVMFHALKGRWRLSSVSEASVPSTSSLPGVPPVSTYISPSEDSHSHPEGIHHGEGDVYVETEGTHGAGGGKYDYRMDLTMRSAGRKGAAAPRNNKLVWRGFYSYNRLTDDWAPFGLKNDKPFIFSRVKSYGTGE